MFKFKTYSKLVFIFLVSCNLKPNLSMHNNRKRHTNGNTNQYSFHKCQWRHGEYTSIKYLDLPKTKLEEEASKAIKCDKIISFYCRSNNQNIKVLYDLLLNYCCYSQLLNFKNIKQKLSNKGKIILFESKNENELLSFTPILGLNSIIMTMPKCLYEIDPKEEEESKKEPMGCLYEYDKIDLNKYNINFISPYIDENKKIKYSFFDKYAKGVFPLKNKAFAITYSDKIEEILDSYSLLKCTNTKLMDSYPSYLIGEDETHPLENELLYFTNKCRFGKFGTISFMDHIHYDEDIITIYQGEWDKNENNERNMKIEEIYFLHSFSFQKK